MFQYTHSLFPPIKKPRTSQVPPHTSQIKNMYDNTYLSSLATLIYHFRNTLQQ